MTSASRKPIQPAGWAALPVTAPARALDQLDIVADGAASRSARAGSGERHAVDHGTHAGPFGRPGDQAGGEQQQGTQQGGAGRHGAGRLLDHRCGTPRGLGLLAARRAAGPARGRARIGRPEPPQFRQRAEGLVEPARQPGVAVGVRMEIVGLDGEARRVQPVIGVGRVDDPREARGAGRREHRVVLGRHGRLADPGDQHPDDRHAPRTGVGRHGPVDAGQDLAVIGQERVLVLVGAPTRDRARRVQHPAIQRRVEALAAGQDVAEPPLVPDDVGLGRLADQQVGPHGPADLLEVVPALAGRMAGHGAVDDLDRGSARVPRAIVPGVLQDRLEAVARR